MRKSIPRSRVRPQPAQSPASELSARARQRAGKFLEAAIEVFLEKGYRDARLSDVVARAGGSLATLYRIYGDKEGLLHAIIAQSVAALGSSVSALLESTLPPEQALPEAAVHMLDDLLSPARIVAHRVVIGDGPANPALFDWFNAHAIQPAVSGLAVYFEREDRLGRLRVDDPAMVAHRFYMAVYGSPMLLGIAGALRTADLAAERQETRAATLQFLRGILPPA